MKTRRNSIIIGGMTMGVVWWVVAFASLTLDHFSLRIRPLLDLVIPAAIPGSIWEQPSPWNVVTRALVAILVAALTTTGFALLAHIRRWDSGAWIVRFLSGWLTGVCASTVTAGILLLTLTLGDNERALDGLQWTFKAHEPQAISGLLTGIVWGWVPALLFARTQGARGRFALVTAGAALLVAVACGVSLIWGSARAGAVVAPQPTVTPTPRPTPPAATATPRTAPVAGACTADDVQITASGEQGAVGNRVISLVLINESSTSCIVDGYPDIAFAGADDGAVDVALRNGSSYLAEDPGPTIISVAPGRSARAQLGWSAGAQGTAVTQLLVAPYAGTRREELSTSTDITDQSTVAVTAWQAPQNASTGP